jgi:hypothetical protein
VNESLDLDEEELGGRAADWLLHEELGAAYADLRDRAWSVALGCYAKCAMSMGAANVPPEWRPSLDEHGMWSPAWLHGVTGGPNGFTNGGN